MAWYGLGSQMSLMRPIMMGQMRLVLLQRMGPEVQALVDAMAACCRCLAGVIARDAPYEG
jgi:hypothetical protein